MFFPFAILDLQQKCHAWVTWFLVFINLAIFFWTTQFSPVEHHWLVAHYGFIPQRLSQVSTHKSLVVPFEFQYKLKVGPPVTAAKGTCRVANSTKGLVCSAVSYMFLHSSWMHVLMNMWFLLLFGRAVENELGHTGFLFFYLLGGILAALTQWLAYPHSLVPVIGASGALAAVLGAFAMLMPQARVKTFVFVIIYIAIWDIPAIAFLIFWFLVQVVSGLGEYTSLSLLARTTNVAWWVHVGGFVAGMWMMLILMKWKLWLKRRWNIQGRPPLQPRGES